MVVPWLETKRAARKPPPHTSPSNETARRATPIAFPFCVRPGERLRSNPSRANRCLPLRLAGELQRRLQSQGRKLAHRLRRKPRAATHVGDETFQKLLAAQPIYFRLVSATPRMNCDLNHHARNAKMAARK